VWTTEGCGRTRSGVRGCGYGRLMTERTARPAGSEAVAEIGIIGGSGFYSLLDTMTEVDVDTPWGKPSDPITVGEVAGRRVAFLPRHGRDHRYPPHRVPYRANLWALRSLGVRQVLGPCAVGGLRREYGPGTLVIPDQFVDRTSGRAQTYFDGPPAKVVHISTADPYCPTGRAVAVKTAGAAGWQAVDGGTLVVIEGPRFSTRAESQWYSSAGWAVVGMTGHPEAVLARELEMCFTALALVTDLDAGVEEGEGVTHAEVLKVFAENVTRLRGVLLDVVAELPAERVCPCGSALEGLETGIDLP
jgi:5'-methylthioadenosine phosphorylase